MGNWFNQELFGAPTALPWGLEIDDAHLPAGCAPGTLFHPTFLYEALWNLAGAALLVLLERRLRRRDGTTGGRLIWAYLMVYTAGRAWIEHLRVDEAAVVLGLRLNEWTAMIVFLVGLVGFVAAGRRGADDAVARRGPESGPEPGAVGSPRGKTLMRPWPAPPGKGARAVWTARASSVSACPSTRPVTSARRTRPPVAVSRTTTSVRCCATSPTASGRRMRDRRAPSGLRTA